MVHNNIILVLLNMTTLQNQNHFYIVFIDSRKFLIIQGKRDMINEFEIVSFYYSSEGEISLFQKYF